jgi:hypothetical protein
MFEIVGSVESFEINEAPDSKRLKAMARADVD